MTDHAESAQAVSQLGDSLAQTAECHRLLAQEMSAFAKDESLRFMDLRLERNGQALDRLQSCHGLPGLIGVQQEWLRDLLQDYASQSMRLIGAMRGLTQNVMTSAVETASENIDRMQNEAGDAMQRGQQAMQQAGEQIGHMAQQAGNNYGQEPVH
ncbi:MAG TPA: hypothetical protein VFI23_05650 [Rhizomicrobium sp.]|nr:hypothetical protein [Rhizomicrobium sp.]